MSRVSSPPATIADPLCPSSPSKGFYGVVVSSGYRDNGFDIVTELLPRIIQLEQLANPDHARERVPEIEEASRNATHIQPNFVFRCAPVPFKAWRFVRRILIEELYGRIRFVLSFSSNVCLIFVADSALCPALVSCSPTLSIRKKTTRRSMSVSSLTFRHITPARLSGTLSQRLDFLSLSPHSRSPSPSLRFSHHCQNPHALDLMSLLDNSHDSYDPPPCNLAQY